MWKIIETGEKKQYQANKTIRNRFFLVGNNWILSNSVFMNKKVTNSVIRKFKDNSPISGVSIGQQGRPNIDFLGVKNKIN